MIIAGHDVVTTRLKRACENLVVGRIVLDRVHRSGFAESDRGSQRNRIEKASDLLIGPLMSPSNVGIVQYPAKIVDDRRRGYQLKGTRSPEGENLAGVP